MPAGAVAAAPSSASGPDAGAASSGAEPSAGPGQSTASASCSSIGSGEATGYSERGLRLPEPSSSRIGLRALSSTGGISSSTAAGLPSFESIFMRQASLSCAPLRPWDIALIQDSESTPLHGSISPMGRFRPITAYSLATCQGAFPLR